MKQSSWNMNLSSQWVAALLGGAKGLLWVTGVNIDDTIDCKAKGKHWWHCWDKRGYRLDQNVFLYF